MMIYKLIQDISQEEKNISSYIFLYSSTIK